MIPMWLRKATIAALWILVLIAFGLGQGINAAFAFLAGSLMTLSTALILSADPDDT